MRLNQRLSDCQKACVRSLQGNLIWLERHFNVQMRHTTGSGEKITQYDINRAISYNSNRDLFESVCKYDLDWIFRLKGLYGTPYFCFVVSDSFVLFFVCISFLVEEAHPQG